MVFLPLITIAVIFITLFVVLKNRQGDNKFYKAGVALMLVTSFLLIWISLAVGIFGQPDFTELMALGICLIGCLLCQFKPKGMAITLFIAATFQLLAWGYALFEGSISKNYALNEFALNSFFVLAYSSSGILFLLASKRKS